VMDEDRPVFGYLEKQKVFVADPHDLARAIRYGDKFHSADGLAYYFWKGITYVTPADQPPMLRYIKGGRPA